MTDNQVYRQALDDRLALYRSILALTVELKEALEDARWESLDGLVSLRQDLIDRAVSARPTLAELATLSLGRSTSGNGAGPDPAGVQEIKELLEEIARLGAEVESLNEQKLAEASQGLEGLERSQKTLQAYRKSLGSGGPAPRFIDEKK